MKFQSSFTYLGHTIISVQYMVHFFFFGNWHLFDVLSVR